MEAQTTKSKFNEAVGDTATLYVLYQKTDHKGSTRLLEEAGLEAYKYQEILPILMKDEKLKNELKGKRFYVAGRGMDKEGIFTVNDVGDLEKAEEEDGLSLEEKVRVFPGNDVLSIIVGFDEDVFHAGARFGLAASDNPLSPVDVIIGKSKGAHSQLRR